MTGLTSSPHTGLVGDLRAKTDGLKQSQVLYAGRVGPTLFVVSCWISARMISIPTREAGEARKRLGYIEPKVEKGPRSLSGRFNGRR